LQQLLLLLRSCCYTSDQQETTIIAVSRLQWTLVMFPIGRYDFFPIATTQRFNENANEAAGVCVKLR
jgi:hypothetical protein